jgi:DNA-binding NtrC family response regulator
MVNVPPLRERRSDIPELIRHLVKEISARFGVRAKRASAPTVEMLSAHDWSRNNVRELRNVLERMMIDAAGDELVPDLIPDDVRPDAPRPAHNGPRTFHDLKAESERQIVVQALERNDWHVTRTAKELGLADHASLLKIMKRHGIKR